MVWQVVGDKGIAITVDPPGGVLPPGGVFMCGLILSSDMCGNYIDTLHVQVSSHGTNPTPKIATTRKTKRT